METRNYGKHIQNQIMEWSVKRPVTTQEIAASLVDAFGIDIENAKKITNVNMKRLADKGELVRVQKGLYGKVRETPFGILKPRPDEIMTAFLLYDDGNTVGYISGPTLLNALGLCTQMPAHRHIITNRYRYKLPENSHIRVYKPIEKVNDENVPYLQTLEAFMATELYPVDTDKPDEALRGMLRERNINNELLIWYARQYCSYKTLVKTIDIVLEGVAH
ncbi:MAG: DUF6088 family protein [Oscillospiraceae bacterium]|nr:DUF6088 family protein [Oscillospiraceae bacterium]